MHAAARNRRATAAIRVLVLVFTLVLAEETLNSKRESESSSHEPDSAPEDKLTSASGVCHAAKPFARTSQKDTPLQALLQKRYPAHSETHLACYGFNPFLVRRGRTGAFGAPRRVRSSHFFCSMWAALKGQTGGGGGAKNVSLTINGKVTFSSACH